MHMDGRIYDPKLGRMLSPDPVTQAPENGQNYNRYSYANNNPLKYSDPSGFSYEACGAAAQSGGSNWLANAGCGYEIYSAINSVTSVFKEFGILGGNGCDNTCKRRHAALAWCRTQTVCFDAVQNVKEKRRRRAALAFQVAEQEGLAWTVNNHKVEVEVPVVGSTEYTNLIVLADFYRERNRRQSVHHYSYKPDSPLNVHQFPTHTAVRWIRTTYGTTTWEQRSGSLVFDTHSGKFSVVWDDGWEVVSERGILDTDAAWDNAPVQISNGVYRSENPWVPGDFVTIDVNSGDALGGVAPPPDPEI